MYRWIGKKLKLVFLLLSLPIVGGGLFYTFFSEQNFTVLDLSFSDNQIPSIEVVLGGKKMRAPIDLGARNTVILEGTISPSDIFKTGVKTSGSLIDSIYEDLDLFLLKEIEVGGVKVKNLFLVVEPGETAPIYSVEGGSTLVEFVPRPEITLGSQLFAQMPFLMDYKNSRLILAKNVDVLFRLGVIDETFYEGKLLESDQHFVIQVEIEGKEKRLAIDTGCTVNILFSESQDSEDLYLSETHLKDLKWEGHLFNIGETWKANRLIPGDLDGFLGASFIKNHIFVLDFPNKICWIRPLVVLD